MTNQKNKISKNLRNYFLFSWRDLIICIIAFAIAFLICTFLKNISETDGHVTLIFVLVVFIISLLTNGYLFGLVSCFFSVIFVNIVFTYPYYKMDFSLTGYPLTFICMLIVSIATCTLASRLKESEKLKIKIEKEQMRSDFLRSVSHDLRTPLTSIIGSLDAVTNDNNPILDSEKKVLLNNARDEAEWLSNMVENILSITKISGTGSAQLNKEPQIIEELLSESIDRFRKHNPNITINVSLPDELLFVDVDAVLIEQVINNIFINSVLHGQTTSKIQINVTCSDGFAVLSFEDNGNGYNEHLLPLLFNRNLLNETTYNTLNSTHGLGLSVCNTIIKAHGGSMSAENRTEGGARTIFTLPLVDVPNI